MAQASRLARHRCTGSAMEMRNSTSAATTIDGPLARTERMLSNERFVQNAPGDVVEAEREKLERYRRELDALSA